MLKPTGFWSYTTSDETGARGKLSQLRALLAGELQQQVGRTPKVNIFQDVVAIPPGHEWERQIHDAIADSSFVIPIVTPGFLQSEWCCQEIMMFRQREQALGVSNLIFPLHYVDVGHIDGNQTDHCHDPAVLSLLRTRQWTDFRHLRLKSHESEDVSLLLETLAKGILKSLRDAGVVRPCGEDRRRQIADIDLTKHDRKESLAGAHSEIKLLGPEATARIPALKAAALSRYITIAVVAIMGLAGAVAIYLGTHRSSSPVRAISAEAPQAAAPVAPREASPAGTPSPQTPTSPASPNIVPAAVAPSVASTAAKTDIERYEDAAARGDPAAMYQLGIIYSFGKGVKPDPKIAHGWWEKAAAAGNDGAMSFIGAQYERGRGVPQDYGKAREWYEKAAAAGNKNAMGFLGQIYVDGRGIPQNYAMALEWFKKGAAAGNTYAMNNVGDLYANGRGLPRDYVKAREWYEKSAAGGNTNAMQNLAGLYASGFGVQKDAAKAAEWLAKAKTPAGQ